MPPGGGRGRRSPSSLVHIPPHGETHTQPTTEPMYYDVSMRTEDQVKVSPPWVSDTGKCRNGRLMMESTTHGRRYFRARCKERTCEDCSAFKVRTEFIPQVQLAFAHAQKQGMTLKFVTYTWSSNDIGSEDSPEGRERRQKDHNHLAQTLRRKGHVYEYIRVPEYHKSGAVHIHAICVMPYFNQRELSDIWKGHTRGSSVMVDIRAIGMRCPRCWPGKYAPDKEKRQSYIVPPPGKASCPNCGFQPDPGELNEAVVKWSVFELSKYLSKAVAGNVSRSKLWQQFAKEVRGELDEPELESEPEPVNDFPKTFYDVSMRTEDQTNGDAGESVDVCLCCGERHRFDYLGDTEMFPIQARSAEKNEVFYPPGVDPELCFCFSRKANWIPQT